jgi:hypothetical protein
MHLKLSGRAWDWTYLAQDRDKWRAFLFSITKLGNHKMRAISCLAEERLASPEGLCSMELFTHVSGIISVRLTSVFV